MDLLLDALKWRVSEFTSAGLPLYPLTFPAGGGDLSSVVGGKSKDHVSVTDLLVRSFALGSTVLLAPGPTAQTSNETVSLGRDGHSTSSIEHPTHTVVMAENDEDQARVLAQRTSPSMVSTMASADQQQQPCEGSIQDHCHALRVPAPLHTIEAEEKETNLHALAACGNPIRAPLVGRPKTSKSKTRLQQKLKLRAEPPLLNVQHELPDGFPWVDFEGYALQIGSGFSPMNTLLSADEESARSAIQSHPVYPYLVAAHMDCCKVGAEVADLQVLEEISWKYRQWQPSYDSTSAPNSELDDVMKWYLSVLVDLKEKVEKSFLEEMEWCNKAFEEMKLLGPTFPLYSAFATERNASRKLTDTGDVEGKANESTEANGGESAFDQKEKLMAERAAEEKAVKEWLKTKHDPSEIQKLRTQCKKKRKQGKHSDNARERLVEWFQGHGDWPYPSEEEKLTLAHQTNLEARQINNWFINQRKRHWENSAAKENVQAVPAQNEIDSQAVPAQNGIDYQAAAAQNAIISQAVDAQNEIDSQAVVAQNEVDSRVAAGLDNFFPMSLYYPLNLSGGASLQS